MSLPPDITKLVPKNHRMTETEWRNLGIQQSTGWVQYMSHNPGNYIYKDILNLLYYVFCVAFNV